MRKLKIYLDTSVISHLQADDTPEKMQQTHLLWGKIKNKEYEVYISNVVLDEIQGCKQPKQDLMFDYLNQIDYNYVSLDKETIILADKYITESILKPKNLDDAQHIALSTVNKCDYIVSWNFKHIVKVKTFIGVNSINKLLGYGEIYLVSPYEFS